MEDKEGPAGGSAIVFDGGNAILALGRLAGAEGVFGVEVFDFLLEMLHQGVVIRHFFLFGIGEIGEKGEVKIIVAVGKETHFQGFEQFIDFLAVFDHGGDGDDGAVLFGDAEGEIHAREAGAV